MAARVCNLGGDGIVILGLVDGAVWVASYVAVWIGGVEIGGL